MSLINRDDTIFVAIDFQERLMPAMNEPAKLENMAVKLAKGIKILNIPYIVTQQYTKGLGSTIESISAALGDYEPIDKKSFSAMGDAIFSKQIEASGKKTVIVAGIEAHVCVQQTVLELLENDYKVYVIQDCIASRNENDNLCSQQRMKAAGAILTSYESILFELLRSAKAEEFKAISALVK